MGEVGHGKPPKHTQFGQPGGNIPGKTSAQRKAEIANAEKATKIRGKLLNAIDAAAGDGELTDADTRALKLIEAAVLKLIKDSEDRGLGTPQQSVTVDNTSSDGTMSPPSDIETAKYVAYIFAKAAQQQTKE